MFSLKHNAHLSVFGPRLASGDMNCQKFNGWVGSLASLTSGTISIISWLQGCWTYFPDTIVFLVEDPRSGQQIQTITDPKYGRG
eukprot:6177542-Pleurochrysis_carterae.AAC.5